MFAITLRDVALFGVDTTGLTLGGLPSAPLGVLLLLRMATSFWMALVCYCFVAAVARTVPCIDPTRFVAALTVRSASEMNEVEQCTRYTFPMVWLKPQVLVIQYLFNL